MAQLDRLEALNTPARPMHRLQGAATWLALVGGCIVLMGASLLRPSNDSSPSAKPAAPVPVAQSSVAAPGAVPAPVTASVEAQVPAQAATPSALARADVPATTTPSTSAADQALDTATNDEALRKARARADKRKAAQQQAQERAAAEEAARLELVASRRAEEQRAAEDERQRIAAVEKARHVVAAPAAPAAAHRGVGELCAGSGGFFAENVCRARECARAELRDDPVCVRLRDIEESRRSAALYR